MIEQTLATCNNFLHTGRPNKAVKMLEVLKRIEPDNPALKDLFDYIAGRMLGVRQPDLSQWFGYNWWREDLDGKSIEIFCDQGMGDTINMLRYLYVIKERWPTSRIVLNNYAFYNEFKDLLEQIEPIDEFTNDHVKCDYHTNILCLPTLLGGLNLSEHYPTPFEQALETSIPPMPKLLPIKEVSNKPGKPCVGLAWKSNPDNVLAKHKSIPEIAVEWFWRWCKQKGIHLYSLIPGHTSVLQNLETLADTAAVISEMDLVVSVDTVTLHLAGAMGKETIGLLPMMADPRWSGGDSTVWYPSVRLVRQTQEGDWEDPLLKVQDELASLI